MSEERQITPETAEFLKSFDESRYPAELIRDYDIIECYSVNGYCETYLVRVRETGKSAVAKCYIKDKLPSVHEHELLQGLHHPDLPPLLGFCENDVMLCVLRGYIEGVPLAEVMRERAFTPAEVAKIGLSLCGILKYLHGRTPPIIHRDIKPENIILRPDGTIALIDFGISRAYRQGQEADTVNFGTRCFSAPEQYGYAQTDALTPEELASIETLCVFADKVAGDQDGFYAAANEWYAGGMATRGSIASLEDVTLMPNLRVLCIAAQKISDISPLEALPLLEKVELKHNEITDISVLARLPRLSSVGINDNPVADAAPLAQCKGIRFLDMCDVNGVSPEFLDEMGDFEFLDAANGTGMYKHIGQRRVRELKLGHTSIDSLSYISGVEGLSSLEVKHTELSSLDGIEAHAGLAYLNITGCKITDLSKLEALPALETLVISEDMRPALEEIGDVAFEVAYEG